MAGDGRNPPKKPGPGRPKGSQNKIGVDLKAAALASFNKLGAIKYLVQVGRDDPKAYLAFLGKLLPKDLNVELRASLADMILAANKMPDKQ